MINPSDEIVAMERIIALVKAARDGDKRADAILRDCIARVIEHRKFYEPPVSV
jgi:hypothetical protein